MVETFWTPARVAELKTLHADGYGPCLLSEHFGICRAAAYTAMRRHGLIERIQPASRAPAGMVELRCSTGVSFVPAPEGLHRSRPADPDMDPPKRRQWKWAPEQVARLRELIEAGFSGRQCAEVMGIPHGTIATKRAKLRIPSQYRGTKFVGKVAR